MNKLKRIICVLISLFIVITFTSCDKDGSDESIIDTPSSSQTSKDETNNETNNNENNFISLNKEYFSHYEWYKDSSVMLVRSEYSDVTLDESDSEKYPLLAKTLLETSTMRKRTMEEEKDNFIAFAIEQYENDNESFSTFVSTLDVQVRRADSVVVSILEDYATESSRAFSGYNYDTERGKMIALNDVVTDASKIPATFEKEIMTRIGAEEPFGNTAVIDYFNNTSQEDLSWTLDYNGLTFYFSAGAIAPTNFGVQIVTVTFAEHPDLFNQKYTVVPDEYVVSLPVSAPFYTDAVGDERVDEIIVSGNRDDDTKFYNTISLNSEASVYETKWFSYIEPYYVKTADKKSYICVFNVNNEEQGKDFILNVYELENGSIKLLSTTKTGLDSKGENIFALPTNPKKLLSGK